MQIDIISDVICPWSFIAKRHLEQALALRPEIRANIVWHAYFLHPETPRSGVDGELHLIEIYGSVARGRKVHELFEEAGAPLGIAFAFDRIARLPNSRDAHRLIRYAAARGKADAAVEAIFTAHFIEAQDIGDIAILARIAGTAGLDAVEAEAFLAGSGEIEQVLAEDRDARRAGFSAVPCFIFNRRHAICGAHEPAVLLPILDAAEKDGPRS